MRRYPDMSSRRNERRLNSQLNYANRAIEIKIMFQHKSEHIILQTSLFLKNFD
jgi:hypothetical protein